MSPLAEALLAAQRRSLATLEKAYVADLIDKEELTRQMSLIGLADTMDGAFLLASLDVLREWGVAAPTMSERVARENGEPKKATEGQVKYAFDLLQRNGHPPLAEQDVRGLSFERVVRLIAARLQRGDEPFYAICPRCHFDLTGEDDGSERREDSPLVDRRR